MQFWVFGMQYYEVIRWITIYNEKTSRYEEYKSSENKHLHVKLQQVQKHI